MPERKKVKCAECGKILAARIPRGGDGKVLYPWLHKSEHRDYCLGCFYDAEEIAQER